MGTRGAKRPAGERGRGRGKEKKRKKKEKGGKGKEREEKKGGEKGEGEKEGGGSTERGRRGGPTRLNPEEEKKEKRHIWERKRKVRNGYAGVRRTQKKNITKNNRLLTGYELRHVLNDEMTEYVL
ncbi:hypothetical protein, partial [Escherichia coli]|uniref:hypothetical protein n=1 Tax=Escherichia coli TaxID=562 RepID=UPI001BDBDBE8